MQILYLTIKKKFFDMIASGEKKEEYREIKSYWNIRLLSYYKDEQGCIHNGNNLNYFNAENSPVLKSLTQ